MWDVSSAGPLTGAAVSVALLIFGLSQTQSGGGGDAAAAASLLVRVCWWIEMHKAGALCGWASSPPIPE